MFLSDVKGDLSGLAAAGSEGFKLHQAFMDRADKIGFGDYRYEAFPVTFWDLFGAQGHPVRTTVAEMGPLLLSRLMDLTEAQEGVLNIAFRLSDEQGLPLLDLIQRRLLVLENQGGAKMFGEPALELADIMRTDLDGRGRISILAADTLMGSPRLYATFLLWLMSELFEELPEVGDPDKPKLVFFFDEAHLLFDDAPKALVDKVEQVARLIRSKGVGVYFVTQNPADVPEDVLGQQLPRHLAERDCEREKALRAQVIAASPVAGKYEAVLDRESAHEILLARAEEAAEAAERAEIEEEELESREREYRAARRYTGTRVPRSSSRRSGGGGLAEAIGDVVVKELKGTTGRRIVRGILGGLFKAR